MRRLLLLLAAAALPACHHRRDDDAIGPGFASNTVLIVTSEGTPRTLAILSVDVVSGRLGLMPGSPADVGAPVNDVETLAVDTLRRRVIVGSSLTGVIAVVSIAADGSIAPVAGSPFAAERAAPSVCFLNGDVLYVGYEGDSVISQYAVDPATGALSTLAPTLTIAGTHVESIARSGDFLFVGCNTTSNIVTLAIDPATGVLSTTGLAIATNVRPDYLRVLGSRLYGSLSADGTVDAFDINPATGALTRLAGAPYPYPGLGIYEHIEVQPGGQFVAVGSELPPAAALYAVNADGSLSPSGTAQVMPGTQGGPEGMEFTPDGRFLYVANHIESGIYVFPVGTGTLGAPRRWRLEGAQIDLALVGMSVAP